MNHELALLLLWLSPSPRAQTAQTASTIQATGTATINATPDQAN